MSIWSYVSVILFIGVWYAVARHNKAKGRGFFYRQLSGFCAGLVVSFVLGLLLNLATKDERPVVAVRSATTQEAIVAPDDTPVNETPLSVSSNTLFRSYEDNEVAADQKYKGKLLTVSGTVHSIDKDGLNNILIKLESTNQFLTVNAYLEKRNENQAAALRRGQSIVLTCRGSGKFFMSPILHDCQL